MAGSGGGLAISGYRALQTANQPRTKAGTVPPTGRDSRMRAGESIVLPQNATNPYTSEWIAVPTSPLLAKMKSYVSKNVLKWTLSSSV